MSCNNPCNSNSAIEQAVNDALADRITDLDGYTQSSKKSAAQAAASAVDSAQSAEESKGYRDETQVLANTASELVPAVLETSNNLQKTADTLEQISQTVSSYLVRNIFYTVVGGEQTLTFGPEQEVLSVQAIYIEGVRQDNGYGFVYDAPSKKITFAEAFTTDQAGTVLTIQVGVGNTDSPESLLSIFAGAGGASRIGVTGGGSVQGTLTSLSNDIETAKLELTKKVNKTDLADPLDVAKGDALVTVKSTLDGSVARTQHDKNADTLSVLDFVSDASVDATAGLQQAMKEGRTVHIPSGVSITVSNPTGLKGYLLLDGTLKIAETSVIGCSVNVRSGTIEVAENKTVTFTGSFVANRRKVFTGLGTVLGIRFVCPEWWGAVSDQVADAAPALNAASACIEASASVLGDRPEISLASGKYLLKATWKIPSSANIGVRIKGQGIIFSGTRLVASSTFTGGQAVSMPIVADATQKILDFELMDFGIVPEVLGSGPSIGMQLGSSNIMMNGLRESLVRNIYISNFTTGLICLNTRLIKFERLGIWNSDLTTASTNLLIRSDGKFTGDLSFENCQFVNNQAVAGSKAIRITSNGVFSAAGERAFQVAGIRFTECILYPADQTIYIDSLGGSHIEDIFINNCQFDGDSNTMIYCVASGTGSILRDIQVLNNYMFGGNKSVSAAQIQLLTDPSGGTIQNIRVQSNTLGNGIGRVVNLTTGTAGSIVGVRISDNTIIDFASTTAPAIEIGGGCLRVHCQDNLAMSTGSASYLYFIQVDTGANYYVITGNMASGVVTTATVREVTAGANRVVANNL